MSVAAGRPSSRNAYRGNALVHVCLGLLLVIALVSVVGVVASPYSADTISFDESFFSPTFDDGHFFGTDDLGRDVFVRTMKGTQITFLVAIIATLVSLVIGVLYGAVAGYLGGKTDAVMMRAVDALYAMPFIFFVILLMVVFERSLFLIFIAIGAINWLDTARIVRGQTMSLKQRAFVDAARLTGVSNAGIILRHIAPNLIGIVIVYVTLTIPQVILFESFLSFLGLGVQEPQTSLGALVSEGVARMERAPWMLFFPASLLALMLFCLNFLGDGLRDIFDPKSYRK
jgi:oligopeptide transport system permease protein